MLRKIRIALAVLFFLAVTSLFLDFTGTIHAWLGWTARIQFLPALLALNVGVVIALVLLTLLLGRVYCSIICPLGVLQDFFSWISGRRKKYRFRFSYSKEKSWLRYTILMLFVIAMIAGIGSFVALLAPYSSYGRIASNIFAPIYQFCNNLLAYCAERIDSYAFYNKEIWIRSLPTFVIAVFTLVVLFILAWRNGRTYCNTVCPVGTVLGFISRFSIYRITINKDKCVECGLCSRKCKASCINGKEHTVDYSRCVACMDCIDTCTHDAIAYRMIKFDRNNSAEKQEPVKDKECKVNESRRSFMTASLSLATAATLKATEKKVDGGLAVIEDKKIPKRSTPIVPAGSLSLRHFGQHCTGCQLCVSACPNGVLRPSTDVVRLMQPEMSYERGYCRPECSRCSKVCPTGAISPISKVEKSSIRIGHAVWIRKNCIPITKGVECGNCARHCPSGAIMMVPSEKGNPDSVKVPIVNSARCIGCGACENLCPARPFSAIYVEGNSVHDVM